jgi:hypothetical protein
MAKMVVQFRQGQPTPSPCRRDQQGLFFYTTPATLAQKAVLGMSSV